MKKYIIATFLLMCIFESFAQQQKSIKTYFATGMSYSGQRGLGNPSNVGVSMSSGFEYPMSSNLALFLGLDFQNLPVVKNDEAYSLEGSMSIIPITIGMMINKDIKQFNVYFKTGTGIAIVSTPVATVHAHSTFISIQNDSRFSGLIQNGIGLEYRFKPSFIPYIEVNQFHTFRKSDLMQNGLWSFPVLLGMKMQL